MSDNEFEQIRRAQAERNALKQAVASRNDRQSLSSVADDYLYDDNNRSSGRYDLSIPSGMDHDVTDQDGESSPHRLTGQYTASKQFIDEIASTEGDGDDPLTRSHKGRTIADRESEYQKQRFSRTLSPPRNGPNGENVATAYRERMEERDLEREEKRIEAAVRTKIQTGVKGESNDVKPENVDKEDKSDIKPRKRRWDVAPGESNTLKADTEEPKKRSRWDDPTPRKSRWDQAPGLEATPIVSGAQGMETPIIHAGMATPTPGTVGTRFMSDEELDLLLPSEGYEILEPPEGYIPITTPARKLLGTPAPTLSNGFVLPEESSASNLGLSKPLPREIPGVGELQFFKEADMKYFDKLMDKRNENELSVEELKERKIMRLLLKVKNGTPPMRKGALRQLTDNARQFGAEALFKQILPLLMERTLEDQERHLLVKVIDRILYKLDDMVRPYTHNILVVIEPLLIDEDYYARVEGREIISNLAKAAGLAHMISTMRPDIDHADEYVRNTTARAFAAVASALGIPALLPFLRAVCRSKKSWFARHTGAKIVQQIAVLLGPGVLPHLRNLVECVVLALTDEQNKVRTIAALALAALAEAAAPYGIESFDPVLEPLWVGIRRYRGKSLAAYLKCIGYIIPLMEPEYANYYTKEVMVILLREFNSPDEEMKKIVLKVVQQCSSTEGVTPQYLREEVLPGYLKAFWVRRMALDKRNYRQVVETTVELAHKVGSADIIGRIIDVLKDDSEPYRKMGVETIEKVIAAMGAADISERLEERLIDGILFAFQEQTIEDVVLLNGFGTTVNALGQRTKPYLPQIVSTILWRLNNKSPAVRQQAADLVGRIAVVMRNCEEDALMGKLGVVLYEYLGEEYPEVLGSILGALRSIVTVVGISSMQPPIKDLLPRLTPILRNRYEKVQENTIDLVGRIADRGAQYVSAREWMRICFELLDMLKAHKKGIRRAANNTFGYIAKAIGPQDVLVTLLNNLRVQERQSRVCTAVAIGIVAETCAPFTVLPALMNEYRVPELNVQNGVLKAMSFMFEYIGEMAKEYVYSVTPLLEDALIDRDQVHRQTAATVVKHISLGCVGLGVEDAMVHLLNLIIPNIFETSPHVIDRIIEGIEGIRNAVGVGIVSNYTWAGLFHAARKVRQPYWRLYNSAYVQSADAMIPYYPELEEPVFRRTDLDVFI